MEEGGSVNGEAPLFANASGFTGLCCELFVTGGLFVDEINTSCGFAVESVAPTDWPGTPGGAVGDEGETDEFPQFVAGSDDTASIVLLCLCQKKPEDP